MKRIIFFAGFALLGCFLLVAVATQESFIVKKPTHKTSGQLKEKLGSLLEELAHGITEQIQLLAQAQKHLLLRMRELIDGDSKGAFSGATHKVLQHKVQEAEYLLEQAQKNFIQVQKLNNFLKGI